MKSMLDWHGQVLRTIAWNTQLGYKAYRVKGFRDRNGWYYYMVGNREYR